MLIENQSMDMMTGGGSRTLPLSADAQVRGDEHFQPAADGGFPLCAEIFCEGRYDRRYQGMKGPAAKNGSRK